ncbi:hypothetical protein LCGC14_3164800, partial [marine sediment metagenome]
EEDIRCLSGADENRTRYLLFDREASYHPTPTPVIIVP